MLLFSRSDSKLAGSARPCEKVVRVRGARGPVMKVRRSFLISAWATACVCSPLAASFGQKISSLDEVAGTWVGSVAPMQGSEQQIT
jgi:hypothetical protein